MELRPIKVVQLIDNLNPGGAEMVAVNLANELSTRPGYVSYLVSSRQGGLLEKRIRSGVQFFILNKKSSRDLQAFRRFRRFLVKENIDIVHAHSTSFYFPAILKPFGRFKLVWHDHYGKALDYKTGKRSYPVKPFARFFDYCFAVNQQLVETDRRFFGIDANRISYLPNFSTSDKPIPGEMVETPVLQGNKEDRLVCLANFRAQKDHLNLLNAVKIIRERRPERPFWVYLVGIGFEDDYQELVLRSIRNLGLSDQVSWLGKLQYPSLVLEQCRMGVLSSASEGLPLAVIEYGLAGLQVVCTRVGQVPEMLSHGENALLVPPKDAQALANALILLLEQPAEGQKMAENLTKLIENTYSAKAVVATICQSYQKLLN